MSISIALTPASLALIPVALALSLIMGDDFSQLAKESKKDSKKESEKEPERVKVYPTNYSDHTLLTKTLVEYNLKPVVENDKIICQTSFGQMCFFKEGTENFYVELPANRDLAKAAFHLNCIDEEYKKNVQDFTYKRVLEQVDRSETLSLKNKYVEEDDTIVLTINVND